MSRFDTSSLLSQYAFLTKKNLSKAALALLLLPASGLCATAQGAKVPSYFLPGQSDFLAGACAECLAGKSSVCKKEDLEKELNAIQEQSASYYSDKFSLKTFSQFLMCKVRAEILSEETSALGKNK